MSKPDTVTPMMAQYLEIKSRYPDALLFYRMGDFYELFFEDAVNAAAALDIALTKRGKHLGEDIPMCGVPQHASEGYLLTLIRKGFRVAVCEQMESPAEAKKRGYKAVVKRDVVRLVTPGTLTEDTLLNARQHNFLAAFAEMRGEASFAWVDVSTGDLAVTGLKPADLTGSLARIAPQELLVREGTDLKEAAAETGVTLTERGPASFDSAQGQARLEALFGVSSMEGFGSFTKAEFAALGALIDYLEVTQRGKLPLIRPPLRETAGGAMQIDIATRRNLELTHALSGGREGSLLSAIDRTLTGAGARLLEIRLASPSTDISEITRRHDAVDHMMRDSGLKSDVRTELRQTPDIERALSRLALARGGPRDLATLRDGLAACAAVASLFSEVESPILIESATADLKGHDALQELLENALVAEPPLLSRDGGFVAAGFNTDLDEARKLRDEGRGVIAGLQQSYQETTGISALKIKHNNVLGYFVETPATHQEKMLGDAFSEIFKHRQTTANQLRFTTLELSELETRILNAAGHALELEKQVFSQLAEAVLEKAGPIGLAAKALAELDLTTALADLAAEESWTRPKMRTDRSFAVKGGRHPVVELALRKSGGAGFVTNDCDLSADSPDSKPLWLLTGPNMAGKSTFLRQNALIALLAQIGSFVPADQASIGVVDQLFSRVGAADDLARGRSTFMVEMVETAAILNQAGPRALVILDEIGRGTATYDGLSIAWAALEHLHETNTCRTLFATHYHELTGLSSKLDGLLNVTIAVKEWQGNVIFLHEVREGAADRSYGVQVAKLAGLPESVIARARIVLDALESGERESGKGATSLVDDLPLFNATPPPSALAAKPSELEARLGEVRPDDLSPREALDLLYELKAIARSD